MSRMKRSFGQLFLLSFGLISTAVANAESTELANGAELRMNTGLLSGTSHEYVYDADGSATGIKGYKLSELDWRLSDVPMATLGFSYPVNKKYRLNIDYRKNIGAGDGTMDDYDWLAVGYDWSHWSHHDNTKIRDVSSIDANADVELYKFRSEKTRLMGIVGYRYDHLDWQARDGYGIYSIVTYRDSYVVFPKGAGISYEQTYTAPYLGLGVESHGNSHGRDISLTASVRYSQWAHGEDVDIHHLRALRFEDSGDGGEWIGFDLGIDFELNHNLNFTVGYAYQDYREIKGPTTVIDLSTGAKSKYSGNAAGLDHSSHMATLGLKYNFD